MRYIGNKTRLLDFIEKTIKELGIEGKVFADIFAGTCSVGDNFKDKYNVIANDFLYSSYVLSKAKLMNNDVPSFESFINKFEIDPFEYFNQKKYYPESYYFIYNNYSPKGERSFFSEENALKIDGIRLDIEEYYSKQIFTEGEYFYLLACLLESTTKVSNTSGTYEAFFKFWESRSKMTLKLEKLEMKKTDKVCDKNIVFNRDANELVREIEGDIAYIDTPYTITQYSSAYHILETIAKYDNPEIKGITGRRQVGRKMSNYSRKKMAFESFQDLFRNLRFNDIIISYSNQSLVPIDELIELAKTFAIDNKVNVITTEYKEYRNLNASKKSEGKILKEYLIHFKKDNIINKSPLNYSGSKDLLMNKINSNLPKNVHTFVDMMGGAFNVGANIVATDKVIYNEYNPFIYSLIEMIISTKPDILIEDIEKKILEFELTAGGKEKYVQFRKYYNEVEKTPLNLFVLHMFSFQNLIRFNNSHGFNTPVGNSQYNNTLEERILNFIPKTTKVELSNKNYKDIRIFDFDSDTLFYFDPPYLITTAEYNDGRRGMNGWDSDHEVELLRYLNEIDNNGYKFLLSNVISHGEKTNNLLFEWAKTYKFNIVEIGRTGARYPRVEVLIKNY